MNLSAELSSRVKPRAAGAAGAPAGDCNLRAYVRGDCLITLASLPPSHGHHYLLDAVSVPRARRPCVGIHQHELRRSPPESARPPPHLQFHRRHKLSLVSAKFKIPPQYLGTAARAACGVRWGGARHLSAARAGIRSA
ncbi:hypothetical protein EVAR_61842_1 [Eumeta japonica]|uniref:Uncharacterized protein n=1 Tax=Eumeta variegata TaxID=151549 RepID=A0A4C1YYC6_EUMVA|nr:hypothetical protein EVAR_61842_1 [Eumeta japonica]